LSLDKPSIVVTFLLPTDETGIEHDRTGAPSKWTVHAPHCAIPQPNFVPVSPTSSLIAQSNGILGSASMVYVLLLNFKVMEAMGKTFWLKSIQVI
jgi:hypothetical protein